MFKIDGYIYNQGDLELVFYYFKISEPSERE